MASEIMKGMSDEQVKKMTDGLAVAIEEVSLKIAEINEKAALECILEAIRSGDFIAYIVPGEMLGQYHYKPYHDMDRIRQSNALLSAEVELLKGEVEKHKQTIAGLHAHIEEQGAVS